jgi:hypothetical protein
MRKTVYIVLKNIFFPEFTPGALKNIKTQVKLKKPLRKRKVSTLKEKRLCGFQNLLTDGRRRKFLIYRDKVLSRPEVQIQNFGFSVHKIITDIIS